MAAFLFSCSHQEEKGNDKNSFQPLTKPKIEVTLVGELRARKSYAGIQFRENQKEIDDYLEKQRAGNPEVEIFDSATKFLATQFEKHGLIKNGEFLLKKFEKKTDEKIIYVDSSGRKISLSFFSNPLTGDYHFKLLFATDSVEVDTKATTLQDLDYAFLDIIPGGNKEFVFLNDYYFMNDDNFDFMIYEIKIN